MVNRAFLVLALLWTIACTSRSKSEAVSPRINHVMLYVTDIDRSIEFYTKVIGLKITNRLSSLTVEGADGSVNSVDSKLALLKFDNQDFVLELAEQAVVGDSLALATSYQHIGIDVSDIEVAYQMAIDNGAEPFRPISTVIGDNVSAKTAFVKGPDGELIEFMEIISGEF